MENLLIGAIMLSGFISNSSSNYSKYTSSLPKNGNITTNATQSSCFKNREFICEVLKKYLIGPKTVFEVGSGTADQTVFFSQNLPETTWQTSDRKVYHKAIKDTLKSSKLLSGRVKEPVTFDIDIDDIKGTYDVIYASNVVHCIPWESSKNLFKKASGALKIYGLFVLYGPYNIKDSSHIDGKYTSSGNKNFDMKLKAQDERLGLREIDEIKDLAKKHGFIFEAKHDHIQANNYILIFKKTNQFLRKNLN